MHATNGSFDGGDLTYQALRRELRRDSTLYAQLPEFVRVCSDLAQFWSFVQTTFPTYRERREFIWKGFAPLVQYLETKESGLPSVSVGKTLTQFNAPAVHAAWEKSLSRLNHDPDGAITAARTLIETVCKHILVVRHASFAGSDVRW